MTTQEEIDKRIWDSLKEFTKDKKIDLKYPIATGFNAKEQLPDIAIHRPVNLNGKVFTIKFPKQRETSEKNIVEYDFMFDYDAFNFSDGNAMTTADIKPKQTIRSFLQQWIKAMAVDEKKCQLIIKRESADNQQRIHWRVLHQLYEQSHHFSGEYYGVVPRVKDLVAENKRLKKLIKRKNSWRHAAGFSDAEKNFFQNEALILTWKTISYQKFLWLKYTRELDRLNRQK